MFRIPIIKINNMKSDALITDTRFFLERRLNIKFLFKEYVHCRSYMSVQEITAVNSR